MPNNGHNITLGVDGALYYSIPGSPSKIARITTLGVVTEWPIPTTGGGPWGVASAADGSICLSSTSETRSA